MATVGEIVKILDFRFKNVTSFEGDNIGLLLGDLNSKITGIICCLDVTNDVISRAIELNVNFIVSHHPLIFSPIKALTSDDVNSSKLMTLIKHDINVYSAHTNLDFCLGGINDYCAELLGIVSPLSLDGLVGRMGQISPIKLEKLAQICANKFNCSSRICGNGNRIISSLAVINGAGGGDIEYIDLCAKNNIDCLVTSEIKHHVALYALDKGVAMIESSHFGMEYCFIPKLKEIIIGELNTLGINGINVFVLNETPPIK